jgi:integrase
MKREKTKHKGIYKMGEEYYITYYDGTTKISKKTGAPYLVKHEKRVGPRLANALREKLERERKVKRGNYEVLERQEKTNFKQLVDLYKKEGDGKKYILQFISVYLAHFGEKKLSQITRRDLFKFRHALKATPKQRGGDRHYFLKCTKCGKEFESDIRKTPYPKCHAEGYHKKMKVEKSPVWVTDSNVNRALAGLRRLFNFAVSREYMEDSPFPKTSMSGLFYHDQKGLRNFFTEEQMEKIVEASPDWLKPMILTAYYTGLREGELLGLRWEWIDLKSGIIYLPSTKTLKDPTGRGQRVVMQKELIDLFESLPKRSECVFCQANGESYRQWHIYKPFKQILKALGIDTKQYSWKELRHTTASLMHRKGVPALVIKDQLRHTNVKTTVDFYIGSDVDYQREMIEKLILSSGKNSGKIVGKDEISGPAQLPTA